MIARCGPVWASASQDSFLLAVQYQVPTKKCKGYDIAGLDELHCGASESEYL